MGWPIKGSHKETTWRVPNFEKTPSSLFSGGGAGFLKIVLPNMVSFIPVSPKLFDRNQQWEIALTTCCVFLDPLTALKHWNPPIFEQYLKEGPGCCALLLFRRCCFWILVFFFFCVDVCPLVLCHIGSIFLCCHVCSHFLLSQGSPKGSFLEGKRREAQAERQTLSVDSAFASYRQRVALALLVLTDYQSS